jgi:hypothetical protein
MVQYAAHEHASISSYLRVAEVVTDDLIVAAGLTTPSGEADRKRLSGLSLGALRDVVNAQDAERALVLQQACTVTRRRTAAANVVDDARLSFEERIRMTAARDQAAIRWRGPTHDIPVQMAAKLLRAELLPAIVALARRASVAEPNLGVVCEVHERATVIVLADGVDSLDTQAIGKALSAVDDLKRRLGRAHRARANPPAE